MNTKLPSWSLEDAKNLSEKFPFTFYKPSSDEVKKLAKGNQVKLIFLFASDDPKTPQGERMWVTIEEISGTAYI